MNSLRPQGRPRRGAAEVGRDKIICRLQTIFRGAPVFDLSRKALAESAGVTPALISYYFPKKEILLIDVSQPILTSYRQDIEKVVGSCASNDEKLRNVVIILVNLYSKDGFVLDIYMSMSRRFGYDRDPNRCEVARITLLLSTFLNAWQKTNCDEGLDAAVLQGAIWGMCRFAARVEAESLSPEGEASPIVSRTLRMLFPTVGSEMSVANN